MTFLLDHVPDHFHLVISTHADPALPVARLRAAGVGWRVRDRPIGVLGTHPAATAHAQLVRQWSDDVILFPHVLNVDGSDRSAMRARGITIVEGPVARLVVENDRLVGVEMEDGRVVPRDAVFVRTVNRPSGADLIAALGCHVDDLGFVTVDEGAHERSRRVGSRQRRGSTRSGDHVRRSRFRGGDRHQRRSDLRRRPTGAHKLSLAASVPSFYVNQDRASP